MSAPTTISKYREVAYEYEEDVLFSDKSIHMYSRDTIKSNIFYGAEAQISLVSEDGDIRIKQPGGLAAPVITAVAKERILLGVEARGAAEQPVRIVIGNLLSLTAKEIVIGDVGALTGSPTTHISLAAKRVVFINPHDDETPIITFFKKGITFDDTEVVMEKPHTPE